MADEIDFRKVPRQALIDALRNSNLGPSNLSAQDKAELVAIARQGLLSNKAEQLRDHIVSETEFRRNQAAQRKTQARPG